MPLDVKSGNCALLVMDCQRMRVDGYTADATKFLAKATTVINAARSAGVRVIYIKVGFRAGYPEISDNNPMLAGVRSAGLFTGSKAAFEIPGEIVPLEGDVVIEKHRVSAFEGTDLAMVLRAQHIETLAMLGISSGGVVLSKVRQAADLDYRPIILRDLCANDDAEVHRVLLEKVLPAQAKVATADEFVSECR